MNGVVLFADDSVFKKSAENSLFQKFNGNDEFSVLPIDNLATLEKTIKSISTFKVLILDWNFARPNLVDDEDGPVELPPETPEKLLKSCPIYSLVYIYSERKIDSDTKTELEALYHEKISFNLKTNNLQDVNAEYEKICNDVKNFEEKHQYMFVPFIWSQAINKSVQMIFQELESADKYWTKELFYSSVRKSDKKNGEPKIVESEPTIEVMKLFQNILFERLVQDISLRDAIQKYAIDNYNEEPNQDTIKALYSRLYYTKTHPSDIIMTGDVYKLPDNTFGVIVSQECNIARLIKKKCEIEMLSFTEDGFRVISEFCADKDETTRIDKIMRAYNQEISAIHLLPTFPFDEAAKTALIDFRYSLRLIDSETLANSKRIVKINSPYIQQLRQRYLSYVGRIGVPAIPQSLRMFNLR